MDEERGRAIETVQALFERSDRRGLLHFLHTAHPADIAQVMRDLPLERQVAAFRLLTPQRAGEVLSELDDQTLLDLVGALDRVEVSRILEQMPPDHAAEVVEELPPEQAERLLDLMKEEHSEDVQELLQYPEDSAGRLMSTSVVAVTEATTVAEAIERIRKSAPEGRGFELYVVDDQGRLVGVVPLRRLLTAAPTTPVWAIREPDVISVTADTDQEEVARRVAKYDLVAVPVVDSEHRLLGTISVEDVVDVLREEASEDIFRLAGSDADELEQRSPTSIAMLRLPWILATLVIELLAGLVIYHFNRTLAQVILLASFMPVVQAISGSAGVQSVTMVVRALATGHIRLDRWWRPLLRQVQTTSIIGAVCGMLVGLIGGLWHGTHVFGLVVGLSMFISVNLAGAAGTAIPMVSRRLGFDPALAAGPFATAFQDVIGVSIFLALATALLEWLA